MFSGGVGQPFPDGKGGFIDYMGNAVDAKGQPLTEESRRNMANNQSPNYQSIDNAQRAAAAQKLAEGYKSKTPGLGAYEPAFARNMAETMGGYQDFANAPTPDSPDMVDYFQGAAPDYKEFDWSNLNEYYDKEAPLYKEFDWSSPTYDRADASAYNFTPTEIGEIENISGIPDELWGKIASQAESKSRKGWQGQRERAAQQLALEGEGRRGLGAALMADMGSQEEEDISNLLLDIEREKAGQEVGIAQGTQALKASRSMEQAALESRRKEAQSQELARVQGINIDEARYMVDQDWKLQQAKSEESKKAYTAGTERAQFKTGLERQSEEDKASEASKAYEAAYGKAQDVTGLIGTQHQQKMSDWSQKGQAKLSAAQLAQAASGQAATYNTQNRQGFADNTNQNVMAAGENISGGAKPVTQGASTVTKRYTTPSQNQESAYAKQRREAASKLAKGGAYA